MISMLGLPRVCDSRKRTLTLIMNILKFKAVKEGGRGEEGEEEQEAVADVMAISAMLPQNPAIFLGVAQGGTGPTPVETGRRQTAFGLFPPKPPPQNRSQAPG